MFDTYLLYPLAMMLKLTETGVPSGTGVNRRHSGSNLRLGARSSPLRVRVRYVQSRLPFKITGICATNIPGCSVITIIAQFLIKVKKKFHQAEKFL